MILETVFAVIVIFTILVAFHEMGHFLVARACGMRVDEFAIGFGPILKKLGKRGDTEYNIRCVPLGGFVRIAGQEPGQEDIADGFQAQKAWKRALVVFAGPFASAVLAALTFVMIGVIWGFPTGTTTNRVITVFPQSEAARIGLLTGDRVLSIDNTKVNLGSDLTGLIRKKPGKKVTMQIDRRGDPKVMTGVPRYDIQTGGIEWAFDKDNVASVRFVDDDIVKQDIKEKDELVSINKKPIKNGSDMQTILEKDAAKLLDLVIKRNDEFKHLTVQPYLTWVKFHGAKWAFPGAGVLPDDFEKPIASSLKIGDHLLKMDGKAIKNGNQFLQALSQSKSTTNLVIIRDDKKISLTLPVDKNITSGYHVSVGVFGFALEPLLKREGFIKSISQGFQHTYMAATLMVTTLASRKVKDDVGGPVMIGKITQSAVNLGPYWVIATLGSLSISLAVINLVPIPLLDGGVLAVLAVEALRRKRLSLREQNAVAMVGLMIICLLVVSVLYSDIFKLVKGLVPQ